MNPSILSNLIRNGFGLVGNLYKMLLTEIFSYNFLSNKILLKLIFVHYLCHQNNNTHYF